MNPEEEHFEDEELEWTEEDEVQFQKMKRNLDESVADQMVLDRKGNTAVSRFLRGEGWSRADADDYLRGRDAVKANFARQKRSKGTAYLCIGIIMSGLASSWFMLRYDGFLYALEYQLDLKMMVIFGLVAWGLLLMVRGVGTLLTW